MPLKWPAQGSCNVNAICCTAFDGSDPTSPTYMAYCYTPYELPGSKIFVFCPFGGGGGGVEVERD